jgi:hypothetical protein
MLDSNRGGAGTFLWCLCVLLFALAAVAFGGIASLIVHLGHDTLSWTPTQATVQSANWTRHTGKGGRVSWELELRYQWADAAATRTGTRYAMGDDSPTFSDRTAQRRKQDFAPGATITIYVNPDDPDQAVVRQGVSMGWLIAAGTVPLLGWFIVYPVGAFTNLARGRGLRPEAGGFTLIESPSERRVRPPVSQLFGGIGQAIVVPPVALAVGWVALVLTGAVPMTPLFLGLWFLVAVGALVAGLLSLSRARASGAHDLAFDLAAKTLTLPKRVKPKAAARSVIPLDAVTGFELVSVEGTSKGKGTGYFTHTIRVGVHGQNADSNVDWAALKSSKGQGAGFELMGLVNQALPRG